MNPYEATNQLPAPVLRLIALVACAALWGAIIWGIVTLIGMF